MEQKLNSNIHNYNYPLISDKLIESLQRDFPNKLPTKQLNDFEIGRLIGQQDIINKLIVEKEYNEEEKLDKSQAS